MAATSGVQNNMLADMLTAEQTFREMAEKKARALTAILTEVAYRTDGAKLEAMRQKDPTAPGGWKPDDWRVFFSGAAQQASGWGDAHYTVTARLEREVALLKQERAATAKAVALLPREVATPPSPAATQHRVIVETPHYDIPRIPAAYAGRFKIPVGVSKADADLNLYRRVSALKLLAGGLSVQVEIGNLLGAESGVQGRSGSIRRVLDALDTSGLIVRQTLAMNISGNAPTRLVVARLSAEGATLCGIWDWPVVESEWERLLRLHEGEKQEEHTLAILLTATSARTRGMSVNILPEVEGNARPDMLLTEPDGAKYVEVETGTRLHEENAKWRMNAALNGGTIALVARNVAERKQLISDCRNIGSGQATDVETLIATKFTEIPPSTPLWAETW